MKVSKTGGDSSVLRNLPTGKLTLLFTDIEGSTRLLQELGRDYEELLARHHEALRNAVAQNGGQVVSTHGDSVFAVFESVHECAAGVIDAQLQLAMTHWPRNVKLLVRMGVHTGYPRVVEQDYVGLDVHRAARICDAGNGGQILMSKSTRSLLDDLSLPEGVQIKELGAHQLKDLRYPEVLFELRICDFPEINRPLRTMAVQRNNLPASPTSIIGRATEIEAVGSLLKTDAVHLVTLSGPGGCGKTRLALEVATSLLDEFPAGVFFVSFASVTDPNIVAPSIAQTLSVTELPGLSVLEALKNHLNNGPILLLLDNFETVIQASASIAELLTSCPRLKLLVTSREPLNIRFEHQFEVSPLRLPKDGASDSIEELAKQDSVNLFVQRVRDYNQNFSFTLENLETVADICRHLDGLPLAIELAAGQLRNYSPEHLRDQLYHCIDSKVGGRRDLDSRHQTLKNVFEWSYNLLTPGEQDLLQRVSVFSGGFERGSAVEVTAEENTNADEVPNRLFTLCEKSLIKRSFSQGEVRFELLETIRQYAFQLLLSNSASNEIRRRHATHFEKLIMQLSPGLLSIDQRKSVSRFFDDANNFRTALEWALEQPTSGSTASLVNGLLWFWISQGQFTEGLAWVERALDQTEKASDELGYARVLDAAGWLHLFSGDHQGAAALCENSLRLFEKVGSSTDIARTKMTSGITLAVTGKIPEGPDLIVEALKIYELLNDDYGTALALIALGEGARASGDLGGASEHQTKALGLLRKINNTYWLGGLLNNLAFSRLKEGSRREAASFASEALEIGEEYNYPLILALCYLAAGAISLMDGETDAAVNLFGAGIGEMDSIGAHFEPNDQMELERNMAQARTVLGERKFQSALNKGITWSRDDRMNKAKAVCK